MENTLSLNKNFNYKNLAMKNPDELRQFGVEKVSLGDDGVVVDVKGAYGRDLATVYYQQL